MPFKKRRYSNETKKPASVASYVTGAVGVVALVFCALMIYASAESAGNTPIVFAFIGIIALFATLICTVYGFMAWTAIYIYGMMAR